MKGSSRSPNRFLMDITLPTGEVLRSGLQKVLRDVKSLRFHEILLPLIIFGFLFMRPPLRAYRCSSCGKILCNICQRKELWRRMCSDCYEVLVRPDKTDSSTRLQRSLFLQKKKSQKRRLFWSLLPLPGVLQIVAGSLFQGLLILIFIGISITSLVAHKHFFILTMKQFYLIWLSVLSLFMAIMIHLLSLRRLWRIWL